MNVILNEHDWAEKAIEEPDLRNRPMDTLRMVARYYLDNGYGKKGARDQLDRFLLTWDCNASLVLWENELDTALKLALKRPAIQIDEIVVTKPEMEKIATIRGGQARRLAFTLLCLSKYWNIRRQNNNNWVSTPHSDIMKMANVSASLKRQAELFRQLEDAGMLCFPDRIDSASMQVLYAADGEPELTLRDFRNIGYQYLKYLGEPFFECEECGIVTKIKNPSSGRPQKYCSNCAVKIRTIQNINSVMRSRNFL